MFATVDASGKHIDTSLLHWVFICDRCGNNVSFRQGLEIFRLNLRHDDYGKLTQDDKRSFCSQICVTEVIKEINERV